MSKALCLFLAVGLLGSASLYAEEIRYRAVTKPTPIAPHVHSGDCCHTHEIELNENSSPDQVAEALLNEAHELSHDHSKKTVQGWLREWVRHFQLIHSFRDVGRWIHWRSFDNPQYSEHISNVAVIFGVSHLLESVSGPAFAGLGTVIGLPESINWGILGVGAVISIPGLDPLCIALAGLYKTRPGFRSHITKLRLTIKKSSQWLGQISGFNSARDFLGNWQSGHQRLLGGQDAAAVTLYNGGIRLVFHSEKDRFFLQSVQLDGTSLKADLVPLNEYLDSNTRTAVEELISYTPGSKPPFFLESTEEINGRHTYHLKKGAVQPWGRWVMRSCQDWL